MGSNNCFCMCSADVFPLQDCVNTHLNAPDQQTAKSCSGFFGLFGCVLKVFFLTFRQFLWPASSEDREREINCWHTPCINCGDVNPSWSDFCKGRLRSTKLMSPSESRIFLALLTGEILEIFASLNLDLGKMCSSRLYFRPQDFFNIKIGFLTLGDIVFALWWVTGSLKSL